MLARQCQNARNVAGGHVSGTGPTHTQDRSVCFRAVRMADAKAKAANTGLIGDLTFIPDFAKVSERRPSGDGAGNESHGAL